MATRTNEETVSFSTGYNVLQLLSEQQYKRLTGPLVELVKNSLDASSPNIDITLTAGRHPRIVLTDNGDGMGEEGLANFYRIGGSVKKGVRKNRLGHPMIGEYGVGNIGLFAVGAQHTLETIADTTIRTVHVDFEELRRQGHDWQSYQHPVNKREDKRRASGTTIEITHLKDRYGPKQFKRIEAQLMRALGKELKGHLKYAEITVNGRRVESYMEQVLKGVKPQDVKFKVEDPGTGKTYTAKGRIWIAETALDSADSGIFPVIKEANPIMDGHLYGSMPAAWARLRDRVYGEIQADFLESRLDLTRDSFVDLRDDELVVAYHAGLNKVLRDLLGEQEQLRKSRQGETEGQLINRWASLSSRLFRGMGTGIEGPKDIVTGTGKDDGVRKKQRTWGERVKPSPEDDKEKQKIQSHPRTTGKVSVRLGGVDLNIRYINSKDQPLVFVDDAGIQKELLINQGHGLWRSASERGTQAINDVVDTEIIEVLSAYRLGMDGVTEHSAVRELVDEQLKKLGDHRLREFEP